MDRNTALSILEEARRRQSCDLADGLIDDLVPYWELMEEAFGNIVDDGSCVEALEEVLDGGDGADVPWGGHTGFFEALSLYYGRRKRASEVPSVAKAKVAEDDDTLAGEYPDIADFIEHGLYEAFSVPDAYGTFDLTVYPNTCKVTGEYVNPAGSVSGYVLDNGKLLLVTRDGNRENDEVIDVRYAVATTNNIHLIMRQCEDRPFEWDSIESPDHDQLRRDGALPDVARA